MNNGQTVFVIDDDTSMRKSLRWLLESVGLSARLYGSPAEFLAEFDSNSTGCVIADLRMPGMSGLELQRQLNARNNEIPIIFLTGFWDVESAVHAMQNGAAAFLEKPVSDDEFVDLVQRSLAENAKIRAKREKLQFTHDRIAKLSKRERETMWMVVDGLTSRQIAAQLGISTKTVEAHRARVMEKMQADNVPHLIHILRAARPEGPNSF